MALSREKTKQPSKAIAAKAVKAMGKPAKKLVQTPAKATKASPLKAKAVKVVAPPVTLKPVAKGKSAAQQPTALKIEQAKAALKSEKTVVEASPTPVPTAPVKPMSKAKARKIMIEASANEAASALAAKWASLYKKAEQIDAKPYNMKGVFEEKTAIVHKLLGWGYILANRNDRLEVLFKDGIKHLISNYKP